MERIGYFLYRKNVKVLDGIFAYEYTCREFLGNIWIATINSRLFVGL